jgi:SAM-dependent methyltransferase
LPLSIAYFVDNDPKKQGAAFKGLPVYGPEKLLDENKEEIAIVIATLYGMEIGEQLSEMGFVDNTHYWNAYKTVGPIGYRIPAWEEDFLAGIHDNNTYLPARKTIVAARKENLSIVEYLRDRDRRDRIIDKLKELGIINDLCKHVCEIGPGTGRFLEKIVEVPTVEQYEVYEIAKDWAIYLADTYGDLKDCQVKVHVANGVDLNYTTSNSCDLIHAHGVFVYLRVLSVLRYLRDAARVCKDNGYIVFDCFLDRPFDYFTAKCWLNSEENNYPIVIITEKLLLEFARGAFIGISA